MEWLCQHLAFDKSFNMYISWCGNPLKQLTQVLSGMVWGHVSYGSAMVWCKYKKQCMNNKKLAGDWCEKISLYSMLEPTGGCINLKLVFWSLWCSQPAGNSRSWWLSGRMNIYRHQWLLQLILQIMIVSPIISCWWDNWWEWNGYKLILDFVE